jgi:hypothetical protein
MKANEADLARKVVSWLQDYQWEVYQEVQVASYDRIADIVATQGPLLWVIECKTSLGLSVMEQAYYWLGHANYISVAVPSRNNYSREGYFVTRLLTGLGIGSICVRSSGDQPVFQGEAKQRLFRKTSHLLRNALVEAHKSFAEAGNAHGRRWSPFKETCAKIYAYVKQHPGCSIGDVVKNIETHYHTPSTAKSCLSKWINQGIVPGVESKTEGRRNKLYERGALERTN